MPELVRLNYLYGRHKPEAPGVGVNNLLLETPGASPQMNFLLEEPGDFVLLLEG